MSATDSMGDRPPDDWSINETAELYRLGGWSDGFFVINDHGHLAVRPFENDALTIDVMDVIAEARKRRIRFPLLLRFQDILHARVRRLNQAFSEAIEATGFENVYRGVYPIKVNQLHEVVEEVLAAGAPYGLGLECGSKAELIATLPHLKCDETLLICNGVKDRTTLSLIVAAQRLGKNVIPVMEKRVEFEQLRGIADREQARARFGVRIRLRTSGAGRWAESGGYRSKFGISLPELIEIVEHLESTGTREDFVLLHFHLGSQISDIQQLRTATREMAHIYAELCRRGIPIRYLDVGGGVGVDYTGGSEEGGINYSLKEYANAVVSEIEQVCVERGVPHPVLVSESGRAMTAHHSMLVVETLGAFRKDHVGPDYEPPVGSHRMVRVLSEKLEWLRSSTTAGTETAGLIEAYHAIESLHQEASTLFGMGYLSLDDNALVERLYWSTCATVLERMREGNPEPKPPEMQELEDKLVDQYLCNFSVFQSMLDHWAIDQPFPVMPLQRLDQRPSRRTMLVDLTCDSDGKIGQYVSSNSDKNYLELHSLEVGQPYYLGIFLMGAYQDILGDAHNLFGRVSEAHVYGNAEEDNNFWMEKIIPGTEIEDILGTVQYFPNDLKRRMQEIIRGKIDAKVIRAKHGMEILDLYMACFDAQTYCDTQVDS